LRAPKKQLAAAMMTAPINTSDRLDWLQSLTPRTLREAVFPAQFTDVMKTRAEVTGSNQLREYESRLLASEKREKSAEANET